MTDGVIVERLPVNRLLRRKVTLWFGMYVWQSIAEKYKVSIEDVGTIGDEPMVINMMYFAIEYGAFKTHKPWRRLSYNQVERAYGLMPQKQLQRIVNCMVQSRVGGDTIMGKLVKDSKKKQAQQK